MNTSTVEHAAVQWLFLDLNAVCASCEQQENPALRGKPVIVVQTPADSAVAIAASYAAKAFGIKTGTCRSVPISLQATSSIEHTFSTGRQVSTAVRMRSWYSL